MQSEELGFAAVRRWIDLLRRLRGLSISVAMAALLMGGAVALLLPARYDATAEVMINPRREKVVTATPVQTLALTPALSGEGKTTTCFGLGRTMARLGASVVVADCDLGRRAMRAA